MASRTLEREKLYRGGGGKKKRAEIKRKAEREGS
jgi:hypothetical protein